jgi:hypothetical protein
MIHPSPTGGPARPRKPRLTIGLLTLGAALTLDFVTQALAAATPARILARQIQAAAEAAAQVQVAIGVEQASGQRRLCRRPPGQAGQQRRASSACRPVSSTGQ